MATTVNIVDLAAEHIREAGRIFVDDGSGSVFVRESLKLLPFVNSTHPGTEPAPDLIVLVPAGTPDPSETVTTAIREIASPAG